jgi:hypothetical protein
MHKQIIYLFLLCYLSACYSVPLDPKYSGPTPRPPEIETYYARKGPYGDFTEEILVKERGYTHKKIILQSNAGQITIDYFQQAKISDGVIFVFPVLGGKPIFESYFAKYFAEHGLDSAIINRQNDFKNPDNVDRLEEIIRDNVIRDRYAMDFFEKQFGKKKFGSFGISRGAINAAITAGIDERLKYNVLVLGGTDLVKLFQKSKQRRLGDYVKRVTEKKNITRDEFFQYLANQLKTDPKYLASHVDARHTLMILGLFDRTVPIRYGKRLREQLGNPRTIYLMADHFISVAYTRYLPLLLPHRDLCLFPLPYIETEALNFYRNEMQTGERTFSIIPFRLVQIPMNIIGRLIDAIF